jgi:DNA-binding FadR family transcriptional regulator
MPDPAARESKSDRILNAIGMRIVAGHLEAGALLPREADLARRLRISRPSLREALKALAVKGLIESRTRRGTAVNDRHRWNVLDADVLRWIAAAPPDREFYVELLETRAIVEPIVARLAAERASHDTIAAIERAFHGMANALPDDLETCVRSDLAFHELIISATGNRLLRAMTATIRTALLSAFRLSTNARRSYENSLAEHWAVAVAIRKRAPDEAEQAMRALLAGTARDLAPAFSEDRAIATRRRLASNRARNGAASASRVQDDGLPIGALLGRRPPRFASGRHRGRLSRPRRARSHPQSDRPGRAVKSRTRSRGRARADRTRDRRVLPRARPRRRR